MKQNIRRVFYVFAVFFILVTVHLAKFIFFDSKKVITNPHNPRLYRMDNEVKRGDILDINGTVLAYSQYSDEGYVRTYEFGETLAHIIGYTSVGKSGAEARYNFELQKLHLEVPQRVRQIVEGSELLGNNIILTIDNDIQKVAFDQLGGRKGAIVVLEPSTGKILAEVSSPGFNPNSMTQHWDTLRESEESALLNRATQGLYAPGSVFKVITAAAILKSAQDPMALYECEGEAVFEDKVIHCYNSKVHGAVNLYDAMAYSCNTYFANAVMNMDKDKLRETAERFYFNQPLDYPLEYNQVSFQMDHLAETNELVETAIGQGRTLTSPLHMALVYAGIANNGMIMKPYIVDRIEYPNGRVARKNMPEKLGIIVQPEEAVTLSTMLIEVVARGTGTSASIDGVIVAGKTGTAENPAGDPHSWFVGYAPAEDPVAVVAIILENAGEGSRSAPIAREILKAVLSKF